MTQMTLVPRALRRLLRPALCMALPLLGTAGLQAQTLVNIKGFGTDGTGVSGPLGFPLPVGTLITMVRPVLVALPAGDYSLTDAWGQAGALYDAWNYNLSLPAAWDSHYYVAEQQGTSTSYKLLLDAYSNRNPVCQNSNCSWFTQAQARDAFLATPPMHLHLSQATVLAFASSDYLLTDNAGGMSISISAVPELPTSVLSVVGLMALAAFKLQRRPANKTTGF
jgi:hypothetical protein